MAQRWAPWWNGPHGWCSWPAWTARMPPVRTGALPRSSDVCLFRCEKRCPTIGAKRWRTMRGWRTVSRSKASLPIRTAPGTGDQREYHWPAAPVLAEGHGLVDVYPARAECHRPSAEHAPAEMSRLCDATGGLCASTPLCTRCTWNLKPPVKKRFFFGKEAENHISSS